MIPFQHTHTLALCTLLAALFTGTLCAADTPPAANPFENYKTEKSDAITVTYPPDEQPLVDEILQGYRFPLRILDDVAFEAQLARWKKHDLAYIAKTLALEKPTDEMNAAYDQFRVMCQAVITEEIREIRIYNFTDIKAAHDKNIAPEGISYVPQADSVSIANYIAAPRPGAPKVRVVPLVLMPNLTGLPDKMRLFNATIRDMRWRLDDAIYNAYCGKLFEIARPSIVATVDKARFPLWIIDGMTNALPIAVMHSHNPNLTFEQILQNSAKPPADLAAQALRIDLDTWLATRNASTTKADNDAYSYFAMLVVLDAIQQNGEDWMPELLKRVRAENSPALNMSVIYTMFTEITGGKDLHDNITNVQNRLNPPPTVTAKPAAAPAP